ncbi:MAG: amidohydrolase [Chloroflexota bacterium]
MPSKEELKTRVLQEMDKRGDEIIKVAKDILVNPETGFKEFKTATLVARQFTEIGLSFKDKLGLTGVKAVVAGGSPGPCACVLGELDSLIVPDHPFADSKTGAAHACGHHAQIAMMLGVALGITKSGVLPHLAGKIAFIAVPAEEYIELEYRDELRLAGKLHYLGGKPELVRLGEFDGVDLTMMTHTTSRPEDGKLGISSTNNGTVAKRIQFIGRSAHAGSAPHRGINALNAAMLALAAIHVQRETFRDEDTVRVHPIITKGGDAVNAVPADVRMETFVRGKTTTAIMDANDKVDRALKAGALAVGAKVRIVTLPGYLPVVEYPELQAVYRASAEALVGRGEVVKRGHTTGSTDMGDLSHIMPILNLSCGGATGTGHGSDYVIQDYNLAVLTAAKAMALTVVDLLADGAIKAKEVLAKSKPPMTKEQYLSFMDSLLKEDEFQG